MKLSMDQKEALDTLLENEEGLAALYVSIQNLVRKFEEDLLDHPYIPGSENVLAYKKARLEGANKLALEIKSIIRVK